MTGIKSLALGGTTLFAGTMYYGVYQSTDNGTSWTRTSEGLVTPYVWSFAFKGTNTFIATDYRGVFLSTDNGTSWVSENAGLTSGVWTLGIIGPYLFAGTLSNGVWRRPLTDLIAGFSLSPNRLPVGCILEQNYPNPFNPTTTIQYGLPDRFSVRLVVFNTLGQQVAFLVNESQEAGYHEVKCDASSLASGVYFYRLQAGSFVQTRKWLLMR